MAILINAKNCDAVRKNLGVPECILNNGRITGMILTDNDVSYDLTTGTIDLTTANLAIQNGTFVPILKAVEVINNTPDPTTEEYQGGIISVVRNGLPQFTFKFLKGWAYARALYSYNSFQNFKVFLVFEDGSIAGVVDGNTLTGYSLGMLNTGTFMHTDGAVSGYVTTTIQLTSTDEYNLNTAVLDRGYLGFNANNLFPITDILMTGRADVSENKIYFKPKFAMNTSSILGGITIANLKLTIDGATSTITPLSLVYNSLNEEYELATATTITTGSNVVVELYDTPNLVNVAKIGLQFYKGSTVVFNPVA